MNKISNNNLAFTARMDIKGVKSNVERWKNIAAMFENKTQKYTDDVFEVSTCDDNLYIYQYNDVHDWEHCCDITKAQAERLMSKTDEKITGTFVKLFNIFKRQDEECLTATEFINKLSKNDKYGTVEKFEVKFWDALVNKQITDRNMALSKDADLKNYTVY